MSSLDKAREQIDLIDSQIRDLFEKRMEAVKEVAEYKKDNSMPIFDSSREDQVIRRNVSHLKNKEIEVEYIAFIKSLMNLSKQYQRKKLYGKRIGYQGVKGAFSHIAALELFDGAELKNYGAFCDVLDAIEKDEIDSGVLPMENSTNGEIGDVMDGLFKHQNLYVNAYHDLKVEQNLLVLPGTKLEDVKKIYSHQQAIDQSSAFLKTINAEIIPYSNTAKAAELVEKSNDKSIGAIASSTTASIYNLEILKSNINNSDSNTTRFAIVSKNKSSNGDRFGLFFVVNNSAGSLAKAINAISDTGYNMTCLRSRAMKDLPWEYYFYAEVSGDIESDKGKDLLDKLNKVCQSVRVLGSYQKID